MELKLHAGNIKAMDAKGEGQAIIAQLETIDLDGDVSVKGCFGEQTCPMLPTHSWEEAPIGKARIHEDGEYAIADFQMNLDTSLGKDWYSSLKFDLEHPPPKQQYSYGYSAKEFNFGEMTGQRVRFLKSVQVHEVSPVLLGAGIGTRTLNLKHDGSSTSNSIPFILKQAVVAKAKIAGKTQFQLTAELAEKSGIEQAAVYQILAGDVEPSKGSFLQAVSEVLGLNLDQLQSAGMNGKPKQRAGETIPLHATKTDNGVWDGPGNERRAKNGESAAYYKRVFAWQDPDTDAASKSAWRFAHHLIDADGNPGAASIKACSMGIAVLNGGRGGTIIPEGDRRGVWDHLAKHLEDAEITAPVLRPSTDGSSKLADQIMFLVWDTEACIERLTAVRDMRAKEVYREPDGTETNLPKGRGLPEDRVVQIGELKTLITQLDALIKRPVMDGQSVDLLHKFNELRARRIDLDRS